MIVSRRCFNQKMRSNLIKRTTFSTVSIKWWTIVYYTDLHKAHFIISILANSQLVSPPKAEEGDFFISILYLYYGHDRHNDQIIHCMAWGDPQEYIFHVSVLSVNSERIFSAETCSSFILAAGGEIQSFLGFFKYTS